ncbi:hypothetical protein ATS72_007810 [Pseudoalteromonas sp. 13-15]|uniref:hypothetical protein n=1 Tax=Pseudoalteromonas TaxID=53246 RepID=UPI0007307826|nr:MULTISPECIES: hypothetical protein [Pseudoalteromonas]AUL73503.1 hypothetical protein ATS72_007810 [Pseudoalteromonas sp. 13-15]SIN88969.1 hypothetical protein SAMN05878071_1568 [Pseudoalteromonas marina]
MLLQNLFGLFSLSAFFMWGFLMAFFFNIFIYAIGLKKGTTLLFSSFVMMCSYTLSDYFFTWLSIKNSLYLQFALYDIATIFALICVYKIVKKTTPSFLYLVLGLSINTIFFLLMYIDGNVLENNKHWWFWEVFIYTVNLIDITMIVALIVDRDILGLHKLKNAIRTLLNPSANSKMP